MVFFYLNISRWGSKDRVPSGSSRFSPYGKYGMRVLVTVGSTRFDALVETGLSQPVLNALRQKGYSDIVVQCGNSRVDELGTTDVEGIVHKYGLDVKVWRFKPSLDEEYDAADLVIGHAGMSPHRFSLFTITLCTTQAQGRYLMCCEGASLS